MGLRGLLGKVFRLEPSGKEKVGTIAPKVGTVAPKKVRELIPQAHGGALLSGASPRKPTAIQAIKEGMRAGLNDENLQMVVDLLQSPRTMKCPGCGEKIEPPVADKLRVQVIDVLAKHGLKEDKEGEHRMVLEIDL